MTKVSYRSHQLVASVCLLVAQPGPGMHVDYVLIAIAEDDVPNGRRCLFIQADALLVVQADMEQRCAAPAQANIDVPPAAEIGRASCRERVCKYVEISVVAVTLKKKKKR